MARLVTFGCSYVYGYGLSDCYKHSSDNPSKLGWPNMLADRIGYECLNKAIPGAGNFEILITLLDTPLEPDDIVIIGYSYFSRYDRYRLISKSGNGKTIANNRQEHKNMILNMVDNSNYEEKNYWDNWLAIQHGELYLKNKGVKFLCFQNIEDSIKELKPISLVHLTNFWYEGSLVHIDSALDNRHPGIESNKLQCNKIYSKLFEDNQ